MSEARTTDHAVDPLFLNRWSPRAFTGEAIDEATLMRLFEAARWAPSASNLQPWRFVYGRIGTPAWQAIFDTLAAGNRSWAVRASVLVVVLSRTLWIPSGATEAKANASHSFDAGAAWASLAFQARLVGWDTHGMGGFDKAAARTALGVPPEVAVEAAIAIGKRADKSVLPEALQAREMPNQRLPLSAIVAEGRYSFGD